jgi:hypothetical protein
MQRGSDADLVEYPCADRIGFARLTAMAFGGADLRPLRDELVAKVADGIAGPGEGLDLSLITQLLGDKQSGLAMQAEVIAFHQLFRSPCAVEQPVLRVLALAAAIDMGGNTPIEFLLEHSAIELRTLYVVAGLDLPKPLPQHDVAIVIASDSEECRDALRKIEQAAAHWPRPLLNPPQYVGNLDRDKLYRLLHGIKRLEIPATIAMTRAQLSGLGQPDAPAGTMAPGLQFPVIVRPRGSHAGAGLDRIDDPAAIDGYLAQRPEPAFFVSRFVDYCGADGLFRKYRIAFVDRRPYACHMAIADRWDIWYLNAGMAFCESKRSEEAEFMRSFDRGFAVRHQGALAALAERVGLDYFTVDCAENRRGELLIFEADNTAVVHNMDSPAVFPYKSAQMTRIFEAFAAMLVRRAAADRGAAA